MRRALLALVALVIASAVAVEARGGDAHERNLVADACVVVALLGVVVARGRARDLPFFRAPVAAWCLVAAVAIASTSPTLLLP
ncbi:MAG TPA: hypothetical protein VKE69_07275, partial [Planctomycetota bacterium]|nr:hypothetical protein [Planctomycetota bacterium]